MIGSMPLSKLSASKIYHCSLIWVSKKYRSIFAVFGKKPELLEINLRRKITQKFLRKIRTFDEEFFY